MMQTQIVEMDVTLHIYICWVKLGLIRWIDHSKRYMHFLYIRLVSKRCDNTNNMSHTLRLRKENGYRKVWRWKYQWTITNKKLKNLAQVYIQLKGANAVHEIKNAEEYSTSQYESISKSLDEFVTRVVDQA